MWKETKKSLKSKDGVVYFFSAVSVHHDSATEADQQWRRPGGPQATRPWTALTARVHCVPQTYTGRFSLPIFAGRFAGSLCR